MVRRRGYYDYYYPPSQPREAKGGIKAQTQRGGFGRSWWAKRWIGIIESFNIGARLNRGRTYARKGQVISIEIGKGTVSAQVQGSRARPYKVAMRVKTLTDAQWTLVAQKLSETAVFAARLLAGEMPESIEEVFGRARVPLFPTKSADIATECSCPDWSNPCKHIAAVHYLLGEEFDRDPFLIFKLRGLEREELIHLLGQYLKQKPKVKDEETCPETEEECGDAPEPLPSDPIRFWGVGPESGDPVDFRDEAEAPAASAPLIRRLGAFPFWRGEEPFIEALESLLKAASPLGLGVFLGEWRGKGKGTSA